MFCKTKYTYIQIETYFFYETTFDSYKRVFIIKTQNGITFIILLFLTRLYFFANIWQA